MTRPFIAFFSLALLTVGVGPAAAQAQQVAQSYGYQPYNDRNPTGFNHPNNMGYGGYVYQKPTSGTRTTGRAHRRFRGY